MVKWPHIDDRDMPCFTHLTLTTKESQSLRTVIPRSVVEKLKLKSTDMVEWSETSKGDCYKERTKSSITLL